MNIRLPTGAHSAVTINAIMTARFIITSNVCLGNIICACPSLFDNFPPAIMLPLKVKDPMARPSNPEISFIIPRCCVPRISSARERKKAATPPAPC